MNAFRSVLPALGLATLLARSPLAAATWDGGLSHNNFTANDAWSTPNNWVEGFVPASSSTTDITFALSGLRTTANQNVVAPFNLRNLTFAAGSNVTQLSGNSLNVVSGGAIAQHSGTGVRLALPIMFAAATNITGTGTGRLTIDGTLDGATSVLNLFGASGHPGTLLVTLGGNNRTAGVTLGSPNGGITPTDLTLATDQATGAGALLFYNGNTLRASGARVLPNGLVLNSQPINGLSSNFTFGSGGDLNVDGAIAVASTGKTLRIENAFTNFRGNITGTARLTKDGPGTLRLTGADNSGFTGGWVINAGQLQLRQPNAASACAVWINVDNGLDLQGQAAVTLGGLGGNGALALGNTALTIGNTAFTGVEFGGAITSAAPTAGSVRVVGAGHELVLRGVSSFGALTAETGSFVLGAGSRVTVGNDVNVGSVTSVPGGLTVRDGGALAMSGDKSLIIVGPNGTGLTVTGTDSIVSNPFQIVVTGTGSDTAKLTVANGGSVTSVYSIIGAASSSGTGALEILNGGAVSNFAGIIGFVAGSPGVARVSGAGSRWNMSNSLGMGGFSEGQRGGVGSLRIEPGGIVSTPAVTYWTANSRIDVAGGLLSTNVLLNSVPAGGSAVLALSDPDESTSALSVGADGSSFNFSGSVTNSDTAPGGLTKVGSGTLVLSGPLSYTGTTRVLGGTLWIPQSNLFATLLEIGAGGTLQLTGVWGTNGVSRTTIAAGGRLTGGGVLRGSVNNAGLIEVTGNQSLVIGGPFQNSGRLRISGGSTFTANQSLVNTGVIDLISAGPVTLPPGFVNQGVILDRYSVRLNVQPAGNGISLAVTGFAGHTYRVQRSSALDGGAFVDFSAPLPVSTDGTILFFDSTPPPGRVFYRVVVD